MRAARITRPGGPEVLEVADVPQPTPKAGEVLVRVRASALNRADLLQRKGMYPAPAGASPDIPGMEIAGEVVESGPGGSGWKAGDRVFGIVGGGANAEYAVTRGDHLARIPNTMSWEDAAAVPEAFVTAHDALVTQAAMRTGERVLVHAVGSGVGLAASQLIRALGGTCYGTARTADKIERAHEFGLTDGVVVGDDLAVVVAAVKRWTNGEGVSVILDLVGGPYLPVNVECCASTGRIILIGLLAGRSATLNLGSVLNRRVTIRGTVLRARTDAEKAAVTAAFVRDVLPLLERRAVRPVVERVFPLAQIADAHTLLESNRTFGKVVLTH